MRWGSRQSRFDGNVSAGSKLQDRHFEAEFGMVDSVGARQRIEPGWRDEAVRLWG
jgi:hypothetical protein